jgi:hypothetical protein
LTPLPLWTAVSVVTGGFAILRAWYYAENNLPKRLQELAEKVKQLHLEERPALLAFVQDHSTHRDLLAPGIFANPFSRLLQAIGIVTTRMRVRSLASSVGVRRDEAAALDAKKQDVENQAVTGHLIRAACFLGRAAGLHHNSPDSSAEG